VLAAAFTLGVATSTFAQQDPVQPPATDPNTLPPLPAPAEPSARPAPPADATPDALAAPRRQPERATERAENPGRRWYGWQIIFTDAAAIASLSAAGKDSGWGDLAVALYLAGGPAVHFAHGNGTKALGSFGIRVLVPVGGAGVGAAVGAIAGGNNDCGGGFCFPPALVGAAVGFGVGLIAASIVDIAALAYDNPPAAESAASSAPFRLHLTPIASLPRDASGHIAPGLGLAASF
jgi:hypothetical protein